jgi:predicted dehydrogenase
LLLGIGVYNLSMQKLRLIQCGAGGMGRTWWNGPVGDSPDFQLVAMVDIASAPLREAAGALGLAEDRCFESLEEALSRTEADAVLTVTPPPVHPEHAQLAFARGLHVLTEKPIAPDMPSARRMVDLSDRAGRQLVVAQNYRFSPVMQRLRSLISEGLVGELGHGHIDFYIPADFTGTFRQSMTFPLLVDMAIHHIDLIRAITGRNIAAVTASTFNPSWSWYDHDAALKMILELDGGVQFSYSGDWSALGRSTSWNGTWRLQCASGSIHLEDDRLALARCQRWNKNPTSEPVEIPTIPRTAQTALLHQFAEAIRSGKPAQTSGRDNLWSFAAVMCALTSSTERRRVEVAELIGDSA